MSPTISITLDIHSFDEQQQHEEKAGQRRDRVCDVMAINHTLVLVVGEGLASNLDPGRHHIICSVSMDVIASSLHLRYYVFGSVCCA